MLPDIQPIDTRSRHIHVVVETPAGSRNKYRFNPELGGFEFVKMLPLGMAFPFDFGFVPSTLCEDGDPLDVMVLMDASVVPGCIVPCALLGALQARQRTRAGQWISNDRLLAVPRPSLAYPRTSSIRQLPRKLLQQLQAFFTTYSTLEGTEFEITAISGPRKARQLLDAASREFQRGHHGK